MIDLWKPRPVAPPTVDPEIEKMSGPQRSAEVICFSILSLEHWLSPSGRLREWVRLNSTLSMWLLIPGVLVLPLITWILYLVAGWATMLVGIAGHLIVLPLAILAAVVSIMIVLALLRMIFGR